MTTSTAYSSLRERAVFQIVTGIKKLNKIIKKKAIKEINVWSIQKKFFIVLHLLAKQQIGLTIKL